MKLHGLDSLRFVGFLLLFICHTVGVEYYGYKVVSFFFILSSCVMFGFRWDGTVYILEYKKLNMGY